MGAAASKKQNPYPFSVPQHYSQIPQFFPPNPYQPWGAQQFPTESGRKSKKGKRKGLVPDEMGGAMPMGWGQGYAPFPNHAMYPPFAGAYPTMPGFFNNPAAMAQMYQPSAAAFQQSSSVRHQPKSHVRQMPQQSVMPQVIAQPDPAPPRPVIPDIPGRAASQGSRPPPLLFTPNDAPLASFPNAAEAQRRSQTPYPRAPTASEPAPAESHHQPAEPPVIPPPPVLGNGAPRDTLPRSSPTHSQEGHSREANPNPALTQFLGPQTPVAPAVFGPGPADHPLTPIRNPLPPPPRDLYDTTPYKGLLDLPHTTALLNAAYGSSIRGAGTAPSVTVPAASGMPADMPRGHHRSNTTTTSPQGSTADRKKKSRGFGLFRSLTGSSHRRHESAPEPPRSNAIPNPSTSTQVPFRPVFLPAGTVRSTSGMHASGAEAGTAPAGQGPAAMVDESQPPVRFSQMSPLAGFLNHSYHRVLYQNRTYPSATHLFEAMKYLGGEGANAPAKQEAAERIRACKNVVEVYPMSVEFQSKGLVRSDWGVIFNDCMDEVLYLKFRQHPDLRTALMGTGAAPIIYEDPADEYWGDGPGGTGANELGKALVRVRERLRTEGYGVNVPN